MHGFCIFLEVDFHCRTAVVAKVDLDFRTEGANTLLKGQKPKPRKYHVPFRTSPLAKMIEPTSAFGLHSRGNNQLFQFGECFSVVAFVHFHRKTVTVAFLW